MFLKITGYCTPLLLLVQWRHCLGSLSRATNRCTSTFWQPQIDGNQHRINKITVLGSIEQRAENRRQHSETRTTLRYLRELTDRVCLLRASPVSISSKRSGPVRHATCARVGLGTLLRPSLILCCKAECKPRDQLDFDICFPERPQECLSPFTVATTSFSDYAC